MISILGIYLREMGAHVPQDYCRLFVAAQIWDVHPANSGEITVYSYNSMPCRIVNEYATWINLTNIQGAKEVRHKNMMPFL